MMKKLIMILALVMIWGSAEAKPQDGPSNKAECSLIGGTFTYLGGDMTSCCTDKGCTICDHSGCHFDEAMVKKIKPKKPLTIHPKKPSKKEESRQELKDLIKRGD